MNIVYLFLIAAPILVFAALFLIFEIYVVIMGHLKGAPFVRSKKAKIKTMLELAAIRPGETVFDLGSGDGTILIEAAKLGAKAIGLEFNPFLVWYSRWRIKRLRLEKNIRIIRTDFRSYPLAEADAVFLYLWPSTLNKLQSRLAKELKPGARIISNAFAIPGRWPIMEKDKIFLYRI